MAPSACNYDADASIPGDCTYPETGYDCEGNCVFDTDGDGVCDMLRFTDGSENALNFDPEATENDGFVSLKLLVVWIIQLVTMIHKLT